MDWPCNLVGAENRRGRHQRWPVLVGWQKIVIPLKKIEKSEKIGGWVRRDEFGF